MYIRTVSLAESAAMIAMARSPEQGGGKVWKVLLGRLPGETVEQSNVSAQQQHAHVLQGCVKRVGSFGYSTDFLMRKTVRSDNDSIRKL